MGTFRTVSTLPTRSPSKKFDRSSSVRRSSTSPLTSQRWASTTQSTAAVQKGSTAHSGVRAFTRSRTSQRQGSNLSSWRRVTRTSWSAPSLSACWSRRPVRGVTEANFRLCRPGACKNSAMTKGQRARQELARREHVGREGIFERARKKIEADMPTLSQSSRASRIPTHRVILTELPGSYASAARAGGRMTTNRELAEILAAILSGSEPTTRANASPHRRDNALSQRRADQ